MVSGGKSYPRQHRVAEQLRRALAPLAATVGGGALLTIRRVSLNGDFSVATIYYTLLPSKQPGNIQFVLSARAARWRRQIAASLNMRSTPKLVFTPDAEGAAADNLRHFLDDIPGA